MWISWKNSSTINKNWFIINEKSTHTISLKCFENIEINSNNISSGRRNSQLRTLSTRLLANMLAGKRVIIKE